MKNLFNNIATQLLSVLSVPSLFLTGAAFISNFVIIGTALLFACVSIVCLCKRKYKLGVSLVMVSIVSCAILVIKVTTIEERKENIILQNDERIIRKIIVADTTKWQMYEKRNPDILAAMAGVILEHANDESFANRILYIDVADRLLEESADGGSAWAYYYMAYKYHNGIGTKRYDQRALDNLRLCLSMKEIREAYLLLDQLEVDSADCYYEFSKMKRWKERVDLEVKNANIDLGIFRTKPTLDLYEWSGFHIMDSLLWGDTNALCGKILEKYLYKITWKEAWYPFLACYYYGADKLDSAYLYYDLAVEKQSLGVPAMLCKDFCNNKEIPIDANTDILPILKYSSVDYLDSLLQFADANQYQIPYLGMAVYHAALYKLDDRVRRGIPDMEMEIERYRKFQIAIEKPVITEKHHIES